MHEYFNIVYIYLYIYIVDIVHIYIYCPFFQPRGSGSCMDWIASEMFPPILNFDPFRRPIFLKIYYNITVLKGCLTHSLMEVEILFPSQAGTLSKVLNCSGALPWKNSGEPSSCWRENQLVWPFFWGGAYHFELIHKKMIWLSVFYLFNHKRCLVFENNQARGDIVGHMEKCFKMF